MSKSISSELSKKIVLAIAILLLGGIFGIILFSGRVATESATKTAYSSLNAYIKDVESIVSDVRAVKDFVSWALEGQMDNGERVDEV